MPLFKKSDLKYPYSWTASKEHDNARINGFPNDYFLYRGEGYEVLPFINRYLKSRTRKSLTDFHHIEEVIQKSLSNSIASHDKIKEWLDNNLCAM